MRICLLFMFISVFMMGFSYAGNSRVDGVNGSDNSRANSDVCLVVNGWDRGKAFIDCMFDRQGIVIAAGFDETNINISNSETAITTAISTSNTNLLSQITTLINVSFETFTDNFVEGVEGAFESVQEAVEGAFESVQEAVEEGLDNIAGLIENAKDEVVESNNEQTENIVEVIQDHNLEISEQLKQLLLQCTGPPTEESCTAKLARLYCIELTEVAGEGGLVPAFTEIDDCEPERGDNELVFDILEFLTEQMNGFLQDIGFLIIGGSNLSLAATATNEENCLGASGQINGGNNQHIRCEHSPFPPELFEYVNFVWKLFGCALGEKYIKTVVPVEPNVPSGDT